MMILSGLMLGACATPIKIKSEPCPDWLNKVLPIRYHSSNPSQQIKDIRTLDEAYEVNCGI